MDWTRLSLEEQVAQCMMVGYAGEEPNPVTRRFLSLGVGGVIFFRDNFQTLQNASAVRARLQGISESVPAHLPRPFLGVDQEGGQVERLPHTVFPTGLTPRAIALSKRPDELARAHYRRMARRLRQLGFNLNFFPTLDVNFNRRNPIIGVRAFADEPTTVWRLSHIAMQEFRDAGLVAVGKHFPGHGDGTVDSHYDLPVLHFSPEELWPFRQAIQEGLPAMLVAHGDYPDLQSTPEEKNLPSSASKTVIQTLLREQCGFQGVVMTDDMCMGAITKHRSPVEAAMTAIRAGVDILLYKQSTEDEWAVFEALVRAFRDGTLPMAHASLARIARLKTWLALQTEPCFAPAEFTQEACAAEALAQAREAVSLLSGNAALLPLKAEAPLLLVHPARSEMGNYAFDIPTSPELPQVFTQAGFSHLREVRYSLKTSDIPELSMDSIMPKAICMVTFNPLLHPNQPKLYQTLRQQYPGVPMILVSAGTPYDGEVLLSPDLHVTLCAYRPANMQALVECLLCGF
jgi:beta-N-acetylhexosaminidase